MKKLIAATLTFATIIVLAAADAPTAGADGSCGSCCDLDPHGEAQVRCALTRLVPCGRPLCLSRHRGSRVRLLRDVSLRKRG